MGMALGKSDGELQLRVRSSRSDSRAEELLNESK